MTAESGAIHLDLAVETKVPCLGKHRFPQLVHKHERRLVLDTG